MWGEGREEEQTVREKKNRFYTSPVNVIDFTTLLEMIPNAGVLLSNICSTPAILHTTNFKPTSVAAPVYWLSAKRHSSLYKPNNLVTEVLCKKVK